MVFSDLIFIYLFLPLCLLLYYIFPNRFYRNGILIIFSLVFYSFGEPIWVGLLVISALVDYINGLFIGHFRGRKIAVLGVVMSLVVNLGILAMFKYSGFIAENINLLTGANLPVPRFTLPIGISFYTFQTISYTVDVYRGKAEVQKSFLNFLLYVSLFFQLVAGPIVRYTTVANEIDSRRFSVSDMSSGFTRFIIGLGKKVIIANCVGKIATDALSFDTAPSSVLSAWAGVIMFSLQIYYDFSGYSDMAIGLGMMFGFHFDENFNYPYISKSASEFWRRWHISLGSFFRDYVYIPMGGNKRHQILNLAVVWFLTGLWHGASWNYILWGVYFGVLVMLEKLFLGKILEKIPALFSHLYLIAAAIFGWALFYFEDLTKLSSCLGAMFGGGNAALYDDITLSALKGSCFVIAAAVIFSCPICRIVMDKTEKLAARSGVLYGISRTVTMAVLLGILAVSSVMLVEQSYNPFLYFRY
ncbi:MAG: MBOAT family protein [Oscillospiraceae bacterium]|nr:MBOAT family protein [Oscillospiraceae bacterium]